MLKVLQSHLGKLDKTYYEQLRNIVKKLNWSSVTLKGVVYKLGNPSRACCHHEMGNILDNLMMDMSKFSSTCHQKDTHTHTCMHIYESWNYKFKDYSNFKGC